MADLTYVAEDVVTDDILKLIEGESWTDIKTDSKAAFESALSDVAKATTTDELNNIIDAVVQEGYAKVEAYKHNKMIERHKKNLWQCIAIDFELAAILVFEKWVSQQVTRFKNNVAERLEELQSA